MALRWDALNLQSKTISVSKQYVRNPDGSLELTRPKAENSVQLVSIPQMAVDLLIQEHKKLPDSPYHRGNVSSGLGGNLHKKILKKAGLLHIRFHDLRHTSATLLIGSHQDVKTISKRLGHTQASTTMNIYVRALQESDQKASDALKAMPEKHS